MLIKPTARDSRDLPISRRCNEDESVYAITSAEGGVESRSERARRMPTPPLQDRPEHGLFVYQPARLHASDLVSALPSPGLT